MKNLSIIIATVTTILGLGVSGGEAANIMVETTLDRIEINGLCSLREAIKAANDDHAIDTCAAGDGSGDVIQLPNGTYSLSISGRHEDVNATGDLDILDGLTIRPASLSPSILIDGAGLDRVFHVHPGVTLTLNTLTVSGGDPGDARGGGILSEGSLEIYRTVVSGCTSLLGGGISNTTTPLVIERSQIINNVALLQGGGIHDTQSSGDSEINSSVIADNSAVASGGGLYVYDVEITDSTFSGNTAGTTGGGIYWPVDSGSMSSITNSTISGNQSDRNGGGIGFGGLGITWMSNVTVIDNTADADGDDNGQGGGVYILSSAQVRTQNSIVAANHDLSVDPSAGYSPDCVGAYTSFGFNLFGTSDPGICTLNGSSGDLVGTIGAAIDPELAPLSNNGGLTQTHMPLSNSPVLDAGNPAGCTTHGGDPLTDDQRGFDRHMDGPDADLYATCDMGAVEIAATGSIFFDGFETGDALVWTHTTR